MIKIVFNIVLVCSLMLYAQTHPSAPDFVIKEIVVVGNKKTKEFIITREMDIFEGKLIPHVIFKESLLKNRNRIFNTGLFVNVEITPDTTNPRETKLYVMVSERWYTIPTIVFELADRSFNEWWYQRNRDFNRINYGVGLSQHNIRGRNETIRLNFQSGFTKNISGSYNIPYINKRRTLGLTAGGGYSENKQVLVYSRDNKQVFFKSDALLFSKSYFYVSINYRKSFFTTHRLIYDFAHYYASDSVLVRNPEFFNRVQNHNTFNSIAYNFMHDKRNIQAYATNGHLTVIEAKKNGLYNSDYYKNTQVSISHSRFYSLGHKFFLATKTKGFVSSRDDIPYFNLKTLGYGYDYIRGYDLYVIDASSYIYNKITLRRKLLDYQVDLGALMPLSQFRSFPVSIYLNTYADTGYGYKKSVNPSNTLLLNRSLEGWGIGLDIVTAYDVVIRTEYSFNELGQRRLFFYVSTDVTF